MGEQRWFYRSDEEWHAVAERLKLTPCPHCKVVGTLIRHGFLYGFDDSSPRQKTVRARRIFCSNRNARPGCGRTFSVWCRRQNPTAQPDHRLPVAVPATRRRRRHRRRQPRRPTAISATGPCSASGNASTTAKARSARLSSAAARRPNCRAADDPGRPAACPRPSPGRLPRRPLSHRRLPADAADLLRLSPPIVSGPPTMPSCLAQDLASTDTPMTLPVALAWFGRRHRASPSAIVTELSAHCRARRRHKRSSKRQQRMLSSTATPRFCFNRLRPQSDQRSTNRRTS